MRRHPSSAALALAALASLGIAAGSHAESALRLSLPQHYGDIPAQTCDETGHRIGDAHLRIAQLPNGDVTLVSESHIDGVAANRITAELVPVDGGAHLRPLVEESHTDLSTGHGLGILRIDHAARYLRCTGPEGEAEEMSLPEGERVALAAMDLLFVPLARGETRQVDFQIAICRGGPRIVDATARLAPGPPPGDATGRLVEVHYELDFGPLLSSLVKPFLPRFSLWFDRAAPNDWMASRMPLYSKGPTVVVVRSGLSPESLGLDR